MPHSRNPFAYPDEFMDLLTAIRETRPRELIILPECKRREAMNYRLRFGAFINACNNAPPNIQGERPQYAFDAAMFTSKYQLKVQICSADTALVLIQTRSSLPDAIAAAEAARKLRESVRGTHSSTGEEAFTPTAQVIPISTTRSSVQSEPTDYDKLIEEMYGPRASVKSEPDDGVPLDEKQK